MIQAKTRRSRLIASASAFPEHVWDRADTARVLGELFPGLPRAEIADCVELCGVEERRLFVAPEHWGRRDGRAACELACAAAGSALEASGLAPEAIDSLWVVADARCAPRDLELALGEGLKLRRNARRVAIDAAGGAAGAAALALAAEVSEQGRIALVVVVACTPLECCANGGADALCAAAALGHGAAATVIGPADSGWSIEATGSWLAPRPHELGTERVETERVLFARHLPGAVVRFLSEHERSLGEVGTHVVHSGARAALERYAALFRVSDAALRLSRQALARHGDLSAAALPVMLAALAAESSADPRPVLAVATGPGARLAFLLFERG